jgi:hypothetical protein
VHACSGSLGYAVTRHAAQFAPVRRQAESHHGIRLHRFRDQWRRSVDQSREIGVFQRAQAELRHK